MNCRAIALLGRLSGQCGNGSRGTSQQTKKEPAIVPTSALGCKYRTVATPPRICRAGPGSGKSHDSRSKHRIFATSQDESVSDTISANWMAKRVTRDDRFELSKPSNDHTVNYSEIPSLATSKPAALHSGTLNRNLRASNCCSRKLRVPAIAAAQ